MMHRLSELNQAYLLSMGIEVWYKSGEVDYNGVTLSEALGINDPGFVDFTINRHWLAGVVAMATTILEMEQSGDTRSRAELLGKIIDWCRLVNEKKPDTDGDGQGKGFFHMPL